MNILDNLLDSLSMYRLTVYVLAGLLATGAVLSGAGLLPFSPFSLLITTALLIGITWVANKLLARVFGIPTNVESSLITALILALIIDPLRSTDGLPFIFWVGVLAMASKYILSLGNRHLFNPAAIAVLATAAGLGSTASWWLATATMLPMTIVGGFLIVRKLGDEAMVVWYLIAATVTACAFALAEHTAVPSALQQLATGAPVFFVGGLMLTEPLTAPTTKRLKAIYGVILGALIVPQFHLGSFYLTPELAIVLANACAYLMSPSQRVLLRLKAKTRLAPDSFDFAFTPTAPLAFAPGQYIECTLDHASADSRGNRRYFTIASSPTEAMVHLGVRFYAKGSSYKRALLALSGRGTILATQVAGDFTLPRNPKTKLVFIAGGIGITPFRSMLRYLIDTKQRRDVVVIYASRSAADFAYREVLAEAEAAVGAKVVYALTDPTKVPQHWAGTVGRVDEQMIRAVAPDFRERTFYLSGPPTMVRDHEAALRRLGVHRSRIKKDFFPGLV